MQSELCFLLQKDNDREGDLMGFYQHVGVSEGGLEIKLK